MFNSRIDELTQEHILKSMAVADGSVRVLLATIEYGMGINCKDVKVVLHYGPSYNLETYLHEIGRAGRDVSATCKAVMPYSSLMMKYCEDEIKTYVHQNAGGKCCWKDLMLTLPTCHHLKPLISAVTIVKETANVRETPVILFSSLHLSQRCKRPQLNTLFPEKLVVDKENEMF